MAGEVKQNLQSAEVIGKLFGITPRYVRMLTSDGVLKSVKVKNKNMYDLLPTIQTYIKYLTDRASSKEKKEADNVQAEADKLRAEADLKQSKARIAEMQRRELEGKMHRSEDVEAMTNDLLYTIHSKISELPGRLAADVVQTSDPNVASALIRAECFKILNELAGYEYDPEVYQRRVKEGKIWSAELLEEADN